MLEDFTGWMDSDSYSVRARGPPGCQNPDCTGEACSKSGYVCCERCVTPKAAGEGVGKF